MFVFAKRESKEEHVARKQQKIQIKADFFGIWEFMICCEDPPDLPGSGFIKPARIRTHPTCPTIREHIDLTANIWYDK